jgi:hypothetical protein
VKPRHLLPLIALLVSVPAAALAGGQEPPAPDPVPALAGQAQEQPSKPSRFQGGLGMMIGVPVGDFGDNVEIAAGISIKFDVGLGGSPLSAGVELTYLSYGSESLDVPLVGMPELSVDVNTSNDIILFHGRVRAQRREGRVRPYVDGLVGLTNIFTRTSIEGDVTCTGAGSCTETGDSVTNIDDVAFSAGGGAGFMVGFGESPRSARLDVSVRYLYGGEAEYLTEGAIRWGGDAAALLPHRTQTHVVLVDIGIAFGR